MTTARAALDRAMHADTMARIRALINACPKWQGKERRT